MTTTIRTVPTLVHRACGREVFPDYQRNWRRCVRCHVAWTEIEIAPARSLDALGLEVRRIPVEERRLGRDPLAEDDLRPGHRPEIPEGTERLAPAASWLRPYRPV